MMIAQIAVLTGLFAYADEASEDAVAVLGYLSLALFVIVWAIFEIVYQVKQRKEEEFEYPKQFCTMEEFDKYIEQGMQLVILDDLVLNVKNYAPYHPGGKFLIEVNSGRDISKFFYGGYQFENFTGVSLYQAHSNQARKIVNSLVFAKLQRYPTSVMTA